MLASDTEHRKCLWSNEVCANDTCLPENAMESCWGLNEKFNYSLMQIGLAKFSDVNKIGQVCSPPPLPCVDLTAIKAEAWLHRLSPNVPPLPFIYSYCPLICIYLANLNFFLHQQIKPETPVNWEILSKHANKQTCKRVINCGLLDWVVGLAGAKI